MASRVGPKGQVVIPRSMRDVLGIVPGDEVDFILDVDVVRVTPVRNRPSLRGSMAGLALTEVLEAEHRNERVGEGLPRFVGRPPLARGYGAGR